jgi:hypothetical protein
VTAQVTAKLAAYGLALDGVGVKDIVLPGEMKTILAQVVEAGKSAEANVIRRREETAATRSLLNTAKVMEGQPRRPAPEGARDAGTRGRAHRQDLRVRRSGPGAQRAGEAALRRPARAASARAGHFEKARS